MIKTRTRPAQQNRLAKNGKAAAVNTKTPAAKTASRQQTLVKHKKDTIESQTGKNQSKNAKNCYEGGSAYKRASGLPQRQTIAKTVASERRQNANHSDKTHEKKFKKQSKQSKTKRKPLAQKSLLAKQIHRNESPESDTPQTLSTSIRRHCSPDYLMSPYLRKPSRSPA